MSLSLRPAMERRRILLGGLGALAALATGPAAFRALAEHRGRRAATRAGLAFGTTVSLTLVAERDDAFEPAFRDAFAAIRAVEAAGSLYRPDSALSRLNRDGRLDAPDPLVLAMLRFALTLAERSGGAFDPTVQPLWTLWSDGAARGERPGPQARAEAVSRVGWRHVAVDETGIRFARAGMCLTLNGLIQGFAADRVMAALAAHGIADAFVDTGEFAAAGAHADGTPWRLGLGAHGDRPSEVIAPFAGFAATSGDDATAFSPDRRDHHIFDPATGLSPTALSRVTVTAPSGLLADGLSTAAFVMGEAAGAALVRLYSGCAARFTVKL
ncbi:thiamine biosynthesis protein ApbE [Methylobacterium sp. Leaf456]|uniref:FAD:protein FMN transferase n=1 Tax=Methylobacterium sp. Leaf456 TaxID=1736382 RepID=UPI0006F94E2F|nr:FAD:protein FMN transferase [Methylobacterium sp. Leaf456]KQT57033.1 thiamine biosynthesis protein ApbE [Methylobacterium sp. Leaf456]